MPQLLENRWLAPLTAFLVAVAFVPGWAGAATSPRWAVIAASAWFIPWFALPLLAIMFWKLGVDLGAHWALLCGALAWGWRADSETLNRVVLAFGIGLCFSLAVATAQYFFAWNGVVQLAIPGALFLNKNVFGETLALAVVAALASRYYWLAVSLAPGLLLASSRTAIAGTVAGGIVLLSWRWRLTAVAALAFLGVTIWLTGLYDLESLRIRYGLWHDAFYQLSWFGNGPYDFSNINSREPNLHNDWLQRIYELGVVGVVPLAFLGAGCLSPYRHSSVVICCAVIACLSFPLAMPASGWFVAFVLGALLGRAHVERGAFLRSRMAYTFAR